MRQGRSSRRCFLGFLLLVTIAILSVSNIPLAQAEEVAEAAVDATGDVEVQTEEVPAEADGPVTEEETVVVDEPAEEEEEPVAVDEPVEEESGEDEAAAEEAAEEEEAAVEEEETNVVREVTETAKSKISEIVGQIKDISPQQKKKIAAGALGVWGVAAGAGWVLNNLGGSDE
eukprot:scaffold2914_cov96-Skeletonema_dohrnii-CCMP3373.AAC.4